MSLRDLYMEERETRAEQRRTRLDQVRTKANQAVANGKFMTGNPGGGPLRRSGK